uniref:Uncharacterized protein n=1 Tax=Kalanchoe fedtschenkoi TaxID=63787 RepID=A0A7N0U511_KALFE
MSSRRICLRLKKKNLSVPLIAYSSWISFLVNYKSRCQPLHLLVSPHLHLMRVTDFHQQE